MRKTVLCLGLTALITGTICSKGITDPQPIPPDKSQAKIASTSEYQFTSSDERLSQKINYTARNVSVRQVMDDLSRNTRVSLKAGLNRQDWQVRDRKLDLFVKELPLSKFMGSVARVLKCKWVRDGDTNPPVYRLCMGIPAEEIYKYQEKFSNSKDLRQKRRKELVENLSKLSRLSPSEQQELKKKIPWEYVMASTGIAGALNRLLAQSASLREAMISGEAETLTLKNMDTDTKDILADVMRSLRKYNDTIGMPTNASKSDDFTDQIYQSPQSEFNIKLNMATPSDSEVSTETSFQLGDIEIDYLGHEVDNAGQERYYPNRLLFNFVDPESAYAKIMANIFLSSQQSGDTSGTYTYERPISAWPGDAIVKHPVDPALQNEIPVTKLDLHPLYGTDMKLTQLDDLLERIASKSNYSIISDAYSGSPVQISLSGLPEQMKLQEVLNMIQNAYLTNWWRESEVLEFRNRFWFKKLCLMISDEWLDGLRIRFKTNKTLMLDDLADISLLTPEQFNFSIKGDEILDQGPEWIIESTNIRYLFLNDSEYRGILRFYASLNTRQRNLLYVKFHQIANADLAFG